MIKRLHIESYGVLADRTLDLGAGLNVIHGPNETGKTTLVRFVRHVLFGKAPRRKRTPDEVALRGGRLGGIVDLQTPDGRLRIARHDHALEVVQAGLPVADAVLGHALGHFDGRAFDAVFSCQAHDLLQLEALENDALRDTLLAAAVVGREVDVAGIRKRWKRRLLDLGLNTRRADADLNRATQQLQARKAALGEAQSVAMTLPGVVSQERTTRAQVAEIEEAIRDLEQRRTRLRTVSEQLDAREALRQERLEPTRRLDELTASARAITERWPESPSAEGPSVIAWAQQHSAIAKQREIVIQAQRALAQAEATFDQQAAASAAKTWPLTDLRTMPWSTLQSLGQEVLRARQAVDREANRQPQAPALPWGLLVAAGLAALGAVVAFRPVGELLWAVALAVTGLAFGVAFARVRQHRIAAAQLSVQQSQTQAIAHLEACQGRLTSTLAAEGPAGLPDDPDSLDMLRQDVERLGPLADEVVRLRHEAEEPQTPIRQWVAGGIEAANLLGRSEPTDFDEALALANEVPRWSDDRAELERLTLRQQAVRETLARHDERMAAGNEAVDAAFRELLGTTPAPADARRALDGEQQAVHRQAVALSAELADAQRTLGAIQLQRHEIEQATSVVEAAHDVEAAKAERDAILDDIAEVYVARALLDQTYATFVDQQQPSVMERASEWMREATAGAWVGLRAEGGELFVEAQDGAAIPPHHLSRGTRDLTYLVVRFALAAEHGLRVPLPLVLDDVLVHQDVERTEGLIRVIGTIATSQQILFLTCQPAMVHQLTAQVPDTVAIALHASNPAGVN
ncbi:MAG: AAA family ATPase [Myxococcota bacterium]